MIEVRLTGRQPEELMVAGEVAAAIGTSQSVLAVWRHKGRGPQFVKQFGRVLYRVGDVESWLKANIGRLAAAA